MSEGSAGKPASVKNYTTSERKSARELVVTGAIDGPARLVFDAWTKPELFRQWWVPKSFGLTLLSCEMDVRPGGKYKLVFKHGESDSIAFFGTYKEVVAPSRLVWTNEEAGEEGAVTTVRFEERGGKTLIVVTELYPSKEALDAAIESGSTAGGMNEQFAQLDALIAASR